MLHLTLAWPNPKASGRHVDTSGAHAAAQYCGGCASPGRAHDVGYRRCAKTGVASLKLPMRLEYPEYLNGNATVQTYHSTHSTAVGTIKLSPYRGGTTMKILCESLARARASRLSLHRAEASRSRTSGDESSDECAPDFLKLHRVHLRSFDPELTHTTNAPHISAYNTQPYSASPP